MPSDLSVGEYMSIVDHIDAMQSVVDAARRFILADGEAHYDELRKQLWQAVDDYNAAYPDAGTT
jgi:hypothetical protein